MKKRKKQNLILSIAAATVILVIIGYYYSLETTRQSGFNFGNQLQQIQDEVKESQNEFNSKVNQWKEGDLAKAKLLEYSDTHIDKLESIIEKYDSLKPPKAFETSVDLFKRSTKSQIESDRQFIEWVRTEDQQYKIRSDSLLQESFEYEMAALEIYNKAKAGLT